MRKRGVSTLSWHLPMVQALRLEREARGILLIHTVTGQCPAAVTHPNSQPLLSRVRRGLLPLLRARRGHRETRPPGSPCSAWTNQHHPSSFRKSRAGKARRSSFSPPKVSAGVTSREKVPKSALTSVRAVPMGQALLADSSRLGRVPQVWRTAPGYLHAQVCSQSYYCIT